MTDAHDAPERIWAEPDYDLGWTDRGEWFAEGHGMIEIGAVEYVRHDLAPQWREIRARRGMER